MNKINEAAYSILRWSRYSLIAMFLSVHVPDIAFGQDVPTLKEANEALADETDNVIETGRLISNIIVVIAFVGLMLNIAFKVMDNTKATVIFLFILLLRGLYEILF